MSLVHRVVILNKPLKIRGLTIFQWVMMAVAFAVGAGLGSIIPGNIKFANIALGFWVWLVVFGGAVALSSAMQMKPLNWWRNVIVFRLGLVPRTYLPRSERGTIYPDPSIVDPGRSQDLPYVAREDISFIDRS